MRKRKLPGGYLSDVLPTENEDYLISATNFALAFSKFANENLKGACEIEVIGESYGTIAISPALAIHAIKTILLYADNDDVVRIVMNIADDMQIEVFFNTLPPTEDLATIINRCFYCGFDVKRRENTIVLKAKITPYTTIKIYAVSREDFEFEIKRYFFM